MAGRLRVAARVAGQDLEVKKGSVNISSSRFAILNFLRLRRSFERFAVFTLVALLLASSSIFCQTVGTGTIVGAVSDPSGAVVSGAKVDITNKATAAVIHVTTSTAGTYTSGPITPGEYV